ncbi:hypothetical protein CM15mP43_01430 [bacterium]|nr:MAG: hypothetical protein CM15mP43_01430 [bacterium]
MRLKTILKILKRNSRNFCPSRNIVFLSLAANYAYTIGANCLITGICQTDYAGYPDCRGDFINSLENTLSLGLDKRYKLLHPFRFTKISNSATCKGNR